MPHSPTWCSGTSACRHPSPRERSRKQRIGGQANRNDDRLPCHFRGAHARTGCYLPSRPVEALAGYPSLQRCQPAGDRHAGTGHRPDSNRAERKISDPVQRRPKFGKHCDKRRSHADDAKSGRSLKTCSHVANTSRRNRRQICNRAMNIRPMKAVLCHQGRVD